MCKSMCRANQAEKLVAEFKSGSRAAVADKLMEEESILLGIYVFEYLSDNYDRSVLTRLLQSKEENP